MPLYLGVPIAFGIMLINACLVVLLLTLCCDFRNKIVKYKDLLNYAVQQELKKRVMGKNDKRK